MKCSSGKDQEWIEHKNLKWKVDQKSANKEDWITRCQVLVYQKLEKG